MVVVARQACRSAASRRAARVSLSSEAPRVSRRASRSVPGGLAARSNKALGSAAAVFAVAADVTDGISEANDPTPPRASAVRFKIQYGVPFGSSVVLVGDHDALGAWAPGSAQAMAWQEGDVWTLDLELPAGARVQYKYAVVHPHGDGPVWSPGPNHALEIGASALEVEDVWGGGCAASEEASEASLEFEASLSNGHATSDDVAGGGTPPIASMTVKELKAALKARGLPVGGKKADLIARLANTQM